MRARTTAVLSFSFFSAVLAAGCDALLAINDLPTPLDAAAPGAEAGHDATVTPVDAGADGGEAPPGEDASDAGDAGDASDAGEDARDASADAPPPCVPVGNGACGLAPQCGCLPGATCDIADPPLDVACVAAGTIADGQPCGGPGCAPGLTCTFGACHSFCAGPDAGCATPKPSLCAPFFEGQSFSFFTCHYVCDLTDPNACAVPGGGLGCTFDFGAHETDCLVTASSTTDCSQQLLCAPGYVCLSQGGSDGGDVCGRWCHPEADGGCPGGMTCVVGGSYATVIAHGVTFGVCR